MKKKTIGIWVIIVLVSCLILASYYIYESQSSSVALAKPSEVDLVLELNGSTFPINYTSIKGTLTIRNIVSYDVYIPEYFTYGDRVQFSASNNKSIFSTGVNTFDGIGEKRIILSPNRSIIYSFDLSTYHFSGGNFDHRLPDGNLKLQAIYNEKFFSNVVPIEIT